MNSPPEGEKSFESSIQELQDLATFTNTNTECDEFHTKCVNNNCNPCILSFKIYPSYLARVISTNVFLPPFGWSYCSVNRNFYPTPRPFVRMAEPLPREVVSYTWCQETGCPVPIFDSLLIQLLDAEGQKMRESSISDHCS